MPRTAGKRLLLGIVIGVAGAAVATAALSGLLPLPTTMNDFRQPGTQPETLTFPLLHSTQCAVCHGGFNPDTEPYRRWVGSMMAQSTRDPIFHAALAIANQDAANSGELCLRCHTPIAWLEGRSDPPDGSALTGDDFDGVTCHVCHRFVDPVFDPENPPEDQQILADLPLAPPGEPHSAQYILDPDDRRRGPFDLGPEFNLHEWRQSPFHRESKLCSTCHDVSNPALSRQPDGSYKINDLDTPHPTHDKLDEFPIERTYGEWSISSFALAEIDMGGLFGGEKAEVSTCQDCHMPDVSGTACLPGMGETRPDVPQHNFNGANSWVLEAVRMTYPDTETGLNDAIVAEALGRNIAMLQSAAELQAFERGGGLTVRVVNQSGHKLPTGYGEGRRMWINVQFLDSGGGLVAERGVYDPVTATLFGHDTEVYEIEQGLDAYMAGQTGLPVGPSFHFVLNNTVVSDNRVPPRGFTNAALESVQAEVVDHNYRDQEHWDEVQYQIPTKAVEAIVRLYHQTTTREYIEFLRDENTTNNAGQDAYDLWEALGKSAPVEMAIVQVPLVDSPCVNPIPYGLGGLDTTGERSWIGWTGTPSVSTDDFFITLKNGIPGRSGFLIAGSKSASKSASGGTLLVKKPKMLGNFTIDAQGEASVFVPVGANPWLAGTEKFFQLAWDDPGAGGPYTLSDGLHVDFCN